MHKNFFFLIIYAAQNLWQADMASHVYNKLIVATATVTAKSIVGLVSISFSMPVQYPVTTAFVLSSTWPQPFASGNRACFLCHMTDIKL